MGQHKKRKIQRYDELVAKQFFGSINPKQKRELEKIKKALSKRDRHHNPLLACRAKGFDPEAKKNVELLRRLKKLMARQK